MISIEVAVSITGIYHLWLLIKQVALKIWSILKEKEINHQGRQMFPFVIQCEVTIHAFCVIVHNVWDQGFHCDFIALVVWTTKYFFQDPGDT